jgi:adenine specific DNA methylase Mod
VGDHTAKNRLFYGDNLDVLPKHIADESVDLVCLDPPFNSNRNYNVIFGKHAHGGNGASAQIQAFDDTWHWTPVTDQQYQLYVGGALPVRVADALTAFRTLLGENDAMAYLVNMAPRLVELRRVLKPTGSLYLHCDPTMSHYLKILLDAIFGARNFINEIIWQRAHGEGKCGPGCQALRAHNR